MNTKPNHRTLHGKAVEANDPGRGLWFGAGGCTYWTDNWDRMNSRNGIPCCPVCGAPGMQTTASNWFSSAERFQSQGNPGYVNFIEHSIEQCRRPLSFLDWYREWLQEHPNGRIANPRAGGD